MNDPHGNITPQFRDSARSVLRRQKIALQKRFCLLLYYALAKHLPDPPMPLGTLGHLLRSMLGQRIFKTMGRDVTICRGVDFGSGISISIGDYSSLNRNCWIANDTVFGNDVMMGPEIVILSGSHNYHSVDRPMREQGAPERKRVTIGDDVWIGTRTLILPGVTVGSHSILAAGSVVTNDVPQWAIVAGNPARLVRFRKNETD